MAVRSSSFQYSIKQFVERELAPSYVYAGVTYPAQVVSWFVQAPILIDLNGDGTLDAVFPMNKGYATGLDTRVKFYVFTSTDGKLFDNPNFASQLPATAGARRSDLIYLTSSDRQAAVSVAHDTGDQLGGDLVIFGEVDSSGSIKPSGIPALPSAGLGRDSRVDAHSMAVGDINGDGREDILIGNWGYGVSPFALLQQSNGTFAVSTSNFFGSLLQWPMTNSNAGQGNNLLIDLHFVDINEDGFDDLVAGWGHGSTNSKVFLNGGGTFDALRVIDIPTSAYGIDNQMHLKTFSEDFDNDGDEDLVILWSRYQPYYAGNYLQYLENVDGTSLVDRTSSAFVNPLRDAFGSRLEWTDYWQIGDFNNDGAIDIAGHTVLNGDRKGLLFLNNGLGTFTEEVVAIPSLRNSSPLRWQDFDKDGRLEIITWESTWNDSSGSSSSNYFNLYELSDPLEKIAIRAKSFDFEGPPGEAYRIYKAAFNRAPDKTGLGYWIAQIEGGMDLVEVSARFIDSEEFKTLYGESPSNAVFLTKVYQNVLGRNPDPAGYEWWLNEMSRNSEKTKAKVLADFSESAENLLGTTPAVEDGIIYDPWWGG